MDNFEIMKARHSVRSYLDKPVEQEKRELLLAKTEEVNKESGLNIQLFFDEPKCFNVNKPGYGIFKDCKTNPQSSFYFKKQKISQIMSILL